MINAIASRWKVQLIIAGSASVLLIAVAGFAYGAGASDHAPKDLMELVDCTRAADKAEGTYVVGAPPLYASGFRSEESPEQLGTRFAREGRLSMLASQLSGSAEVERYEAYRSVDRADIGFRAVDGRTIAVLSVVNSDGWKVAGSIRCASTGR